MPFSLQRQAEIRNGWLKTRLHTILPEILRREGLDMWIVCAREYNEDPVLMSLLPEPSQSARRRTLLVFAFTSSGEFECLSLDRYGYPGFYTQMWTPSDETQAECLTRVVAAHNPQRIGINTSSLFAFADGLSHGEHGLSLIHLGRCRRSTRCRSRWSPHQYKKTNTTARGRSEPSRYV